MGAVPSTTWHRRYRLHWHSCATPMHRYRPDRISLFLQREPFGEIAAATLSRFWPEQYGRDYSVRWYDSRPGREAASGQIWFVNAYLNTIFTRDVSPFSTRSGASFRAVRCGGNARCSGPTLPWQRRLWRRTGWRRPACKWNRPCPTPDRSLSSPATTRCSYWTGERD